MKIKFYFLVLILIVSACQMNTESSNELMTVFLDKGSLNTTFPILDTYSIFLSDKKGNVISCKSLIDKEIVSFQDTLIFEDNYFDLSIVSSRIERPGIERISIETFTNIKRKEWCFNQNFSVSNFFSPIVILSSDTIPNNIEYIINEGCKIDSTINFGANLSVKFNRTFNYLFLNIKMEDESFNRFNEFHDLNNMDTITIKKEDYLIVEYDTFFSSNLNQIEIREVIGIEMLNSSQKQVKLYQCSIDNSFIMPDRKIWYPTNLFSEYSVLISARRDSTECLLRHFGSSIFEYNPEFNKSEIIGDQFGYSIESLEENIDYLSSTWHSENSFQEIEWIINHDPNGLNNFILPNLPECASKNIINNNTIEFKLHNLKSHNYQNFDSYKEYLDSRFGNSIDISGGTYEQKIHYK